MKMKPQRYFGDFPLSELHDFFMRSRTNDTSGCSFRNAVQRTAESLTKADLLALATAARALAESFDAYAARAKE